MKTIFITIFDASIVKNILRTDVFKILKKPNIRIVLVVYKEKEEYYRKCFGAKNVIIETFPESNFWKRLENRFFNLGFVGVHSNTVRMRIIEEWKKKRSVLRYILKKTIWFLGAYRFWREFLRGIHFLLPSYLFRELFEKYKPDIIFTPNMLSGEDMVILREAKKKNILTLGMIKSWDSLTATTFIMEKPDHLIVNNPRIKKEAILLADFPERYIFISGVPQWDIYQKSDIIVSRQEFFKKMGLDPDKKTILYCASGDDLTPNDLGILQIINSFIQEQKIVQSVQILVRPHPKFPSRAEEIGYLPNFIIDRPGHYTSPNFSPSWEFEEKDIIHLANSLYHSDLVINTASTMSIEAAIFDKPIISIGFDGYQKRDYYYSVARYHDFIHFRPIVESGGVQVAYSREELLAYVNEYLAHPQRDTVGRERIQKEQCYKLDGRAGERIANFILKIIES